MWPSALLLAAAVVGALDALYFVLVTYGAMRPDARLVPRVCRMDEDSCARIVHTRWGRLLGLPNAVYGLAWYLLVGGVAVADLAGASPGWCALLLAGAAATVAVSAVLAWALVRRLRVACPLCFLGHGLNVAILGLILWACLS